MTYERSLERLDVYLRLKNLRKLRFSQLLNESARIFMDDEIHAMENLLRQKATS
ncbi:hypothetical protein J2Z69_000740 [Paenibacillus shirakamiensis]|uniref:Fur-regulated basic protein FbpA n=1 Tax=Paenibacillus shirakamiensis TaxID=1265935 RepID=A0ABS4JFI3_9BACL|nr:hypothetical protein [Paenibacillus shirakamiensis]